MFGYKISLEKAPRAPKASKPSQAPAKPKATKVPLTGKQTSTVKPSASLKTPRRRMSKKKKVFISLALVLVLSGAGMYAIQQSLSGPAIGTVVSTLPTVTRVPQVELKQFDGTNFSFALPVTFTEQAVKPGTNNGANNLENRTFVSSEMMTQVLVTTVTKLPSGNVEEDPSYMLRMQDPAKYKMKPIVVKNEKVVIFASNDTQQMQQTAFWAHGGKLLTITLSGVATDVQVTTALYDDLIESIVWR